MVVEVCSDLGAVLLGWGCWIVVPALRKVPGSMTMLPSSLGFEVAVLKVVAHEAVFFGS
jgi:hypothetical protein